jgi:hypothetical protein
MPLSQRKFGGIKMKKRLLNMFLASALFALLIPVGAMAASRGGGGGAHFSGGGGRAYSSGGFSGGAGRAVAPGGRAYYGGGGYYRGGGYYGGGYYRGGGFYGGGLYLGFGVPYGYGAYGYAPAPVPPPCGFYDQGGYWHAAPCYGGSVGY